MQGTRIDDTHLNTRTGTGIPLLVKYDSRLRAQADGKVQAVVQVWTERLSVSGARASWASDPSLCPQSMRQDSSIPPLPSSRAGLDLATTLERIQQSFVISDPTLPDCPIVFASDNFIEFTGYAPTTRG